MFQVYIYIDYTFAYDYSRFCNLQLRRWSRALHVTQHQPIKTT